MQMKSVSLKNFSMKVHKQAAPLSSAIHDSIRFYSKELVLSRSSAAENKFYGRGKSFQDEA